MLRSNTIAEIYGFSACLIALVVFISTLPSLIQNTADYIHPEEADVPEVMTQSFEKWKIDFVRSCYFQEVDHGLSRYTPMVPVPDDSKLHTLYVDEMAKESQRHTHSVSILFWEKIAYVLLSVVVFLFHWRWLLRQSSAFEMHAG